jgi:hypothetical protein
VTDCTKSASIQPNGKVSAPASAILKAWAIHNTDIRIEGSVAGGSVATLYDIQGRMVFNKVLEEGEENTLPTPGIKTGIYVLHVNDHGKVQTFKIPVRE